MMLGFSVAPSVPEPAPKASGHVVPDTLIHVIEKLRDTRCIEPNVGDALVHLIRERDAFGRAKYGQPLMSNDGRNGIEDARQELGDLLQYIMKCRLADDDMTDFLNILENAMLVMRMLCTKKNEEQP